MAEVGVWRGGSARVMRLSDPAKHLWLFDTFCGAVDVDPEKDQIPEMSGHLEQWRSTNLGAVQEYLAEFDKITILPGRFPDTAALAKDRTFSFAHIDCDVYAAVRDSCRFFYPRMIEGGAIIFDDYYYPEFPGCKLAVDEFFADKPETVEQTAGQQAMVRKGKNISTNAVLHDGEDGFVKLGSAVTIGPCAYIDGSGGVEIGDRTQIGAGAKILSSEARQIPVSGQPAQMSYARVTVGPDCIIEPGAILMPGTILGERCIVSAGAVVPGDIYPAETVLLGPAAVPARLDAPDDEVPEEAEPESAEPEMPACLGQGD